MPATAFFLLMAAYVILKSQLVNMILAAILLATMLLATALLLSCLQSSCALAIADASLIKIN